MDSFRGLLYTCTILTVTLFSFGPQTATAEKFDYYWREYAGVIPSDAVLAGNSSEGTPLYIGQAILKKNSYQGGIHPVGIQKGNVEVLPTLDNYATYNKFVKILCSPKHQNFHWVNATERTFYIAIAREFPVEGGFANGELLYIARADSDRGQFIGQVSGDFVSAKMYGNAYGRFSSVSEYQVLVYRENVPDTSCMSAE